jgi:hypothetical protein
VKSVCPSSWIYNCGGRGRKPKNNKKESKNFFEGRQEFSTSVGVGIKEEQAS